MNLSNNGGCCAPLGLQNQLIGSSWYPYGINSICNVPLGPQSKTFCFFINSIYYFINVCSTNYFIKQSYINLFKL